MEAAMATVVAVEEFREEEELYMLQEDN